MLDKKIGVGQPKRIENATIMVANTSMDTDKVKIYGSRVRVDSLAKVAEIEAAEVRNSHLIHPRMHACYNACVSYVCVLKWGAR